MPRVHELIALAWLAGCVPPTPVCEALPLDTPVLLSSAGYRRSQSLSAAGNGADVWLGWDGADAEGDFLEAHVARLGCGATFAVDTRLRDSTLQPSSPVLAVDERGVVVVVFDDGEGLGWQLLSSEGTALTRPSALENGQSGTVTRRHTATAGPGGFGLGYTRLDDSGEHPVVLPIDPSGRPAPLLRPPVPIGLPLHPGVDVAIDSKGTLWSAVEATGIELRAQDRLVQTFTSVVAPPAQPVVDTHRTDPWVAWLEGELLVVGTPDREPATLQQDFGTIAEVQLVADREGAVVLWRRVDRGASEVLASRVELDGDTLTFGPPRYVVTGTVDAIALAPHPDGDVLAAWVGQDGLTAQRLEL
jgi:hypothetical protein